MTTNSMPELREDLTNVRRAITRAILFANKMRLNSHNGMWFSMMNIHLQKALFWTDKALVALGEDLRGSPTDLRTHPTGKGWVDRKELRDHMVNGCTITEHILKRIKVGPDMILTYDAIATTWRNLHEAKHFLDVFVIQTQNEPEPESKTETNDIS